jgi:hypothetical protein
MCTTNDNSNINLCPGARSSKETSLDSSKGNYAINIPMEQDITMISGPGNNCNVVQDIPGKDNIRYDFTSLFLRDIDATGGQVHGVALGEHGGEQRDPRDSGHGVEQVREEGTGGGQHEHGAGGRGWDGRVDQLARKGHQGVAHHVGVLPEGGEHGQGAHSGGGNERVGQIKIVKGLQTVRLRKTRGLIPDGLVQTRILNFTR